jgi:hypothetical protein
MYGLVLTLHSLIRWVVVVVGVAVVVRSLYGFFGGKSWTQLDDRLGMGFTISMDLQLLLGLLLYVVSPLTRAAMSDFGAAMSSGPLRYFAVEHVVIMIIAVILAHVGRSRSRKAADDRSKFKQASIFFTLSMVAVLLAIPWPFMANFADRPWIRLGL